jgi:hypothetical protein
VVVRGDTAGWGTGLAVEVDVATVNGVDGWRIGDGAAVTTAVGVESAEGERRITVALCRGSRADRSRMAA